jgi:adenylate cyclase
MSATRRLAAILAADVVGYSRLMNADEEGTLARLVEIRQAILDPAVGRSGGRIVKTTGDGFLVEFPSAVEALRCALEIQGQVRDHEKEHEPERRFQFRIGINVGDVIASEDDIHGDGVNVAARLEALAEPGGILVSATVHATAANRLQCSFDDLGERTLKNIEKPVRVYRVGMVVKVAERLALALPDKPSLVVLPFQNMSGDPEQEYFADGMVEDITTALSRIGGLFVIARNSAFSYKGRTIDVRQVGRELGVRYVLEGSVRKGGNRVRIACQLINASTASHVWADRFDSNFDDIFDLQDRMTESVAGAIEPTLRKLEIERATNKPTENLDAYDLYLRASHHADLMTRADLIEALRLLRKAIAIDPRFALAKALIGLCILRQRSLTYLAYDAPEVAEAVGFARSALTDANDDPTTLCFAGQSVAMLVPDVVAGRLALDRALSLNPNSALALRISGLIWNNIGDWATAREELARAIRLSPRDSAMPLIQQYLAEATAGLGDFEQALVLQRKVVAAFPGELYGRRALLHYLVMAGRLDEAKELARKLVVEIPDFTLATELSRRADENVEFRESAIRAFRIAGVPESYSNDAVIEASGCQIHPSTIDRQRG